MGIVFRSWKSGEVMAVPNGANEGGVKGSGWSVMVEGGMSVANEGAIVNIKRWQIVAVRS